MNLQLHLTDDTQLRAHGYLAGGSLVAEVCWDIPAPGSRRSQGTLWGTTTAMRRLAELILAAARLAEEEAAWQAHATSTTTAAAEQGRVA